MGLAGPIINRVFATAGKWQTLEEHVHVITYALLPAHPARLLSKTWTTIFNLLLLQKLFSSPVGSLYPASLQSLHSLSNDYVFLFQIKFNNYILGSSLNFKLQYCSCMSDVETKLNRLFNSRVENCKNGISQFNLLISWKKSFLLIFFKMVSSTPKT